jgi:IS5 family transposase
MLRIYFLQQWFNLSDPGLEEALYDSLAMRGFVGIDLGREPVPDETTACKFRHLLEKHQIGRQLFEQVHVHFEKHGRKVAAVPSLMRPSSAPRARRRTPAESVTRMCIRRRRASSGISA